MIISRARRNEDRSNTSGRTRMDYKINALQKARGINFTTEEIIKEGLITINSTISLRQKIKFKKHWVVTMKRMCDFKFKPFYNFV